MAQIYNSLKDLICPQLISKSSHIVGEKESNVSTASDSIIASLLGVILKNGDTPQMRNLLDEAANLDIVPQFGNICEERISEDQRKIGDNFLQQLLGDKAADFTNPIAAHAGISKVATNRLVAMVAPTVAGYLGNLLQKDKRNLQQLLQQIGDEKHLFASFIPSNLMDNFGLSSIFNKNKTTVVEEPKKKNGWLMWLILAILVILLFFWWRSCNRMDTSSTNESMAYRDTVTRVAPAAATVPAERTATMDRDTASLTLSNGQTIRFYKDGMEKEMVDYLNSNAYKNATAEELQSKWFQFDNITFEFNSSTDFMEHSQQQLNNIVAILKSFPNAQVRIAGFADNRGSEDVNMEISKERAKTIERIFDERGVGKQVVRTEGFGDEYATRPASASDSERAKDRDIALRFVK